MKHNVKDRLIIAGLFCWFSQLTIAELSSDFVPFVAIPQYYQEAR